MALLLISAFFTIVFYVSLTEADDAVMVVEADVLASVPNITVVSIEVPDHIFFGEIKKGECSNVQYFKINNTGNVDVNVVPELEYSSEKIFSYLYFSKYSPTNYTRIGDFDVEIQNRASASMKVKLDLTDYSEEISQDMIGHKANILFVAMEK